MARRRATPAGLGPAVGEVAAKVVRATMMVKMENCISAIFLLGFISNLARLNGLC